MHLRGDEASAIAGGGILAVAIRRFQQVFDGVRQLSGGEPAGRAFKTLDHGEAGADLAVEVTTDPFRAVEMAARIRPDVVVCEPDTEDPDRGPGQGLHGIELVVISADQQSQSFARGWFYLARLLANNAIVLQEESTSEGTVLKPLSRLDLERLAATASERRRAA
jgi:hypothetical protein